MKGQQMLFVVLTLALMLVLAVGLSQAEGPDTPQNTAGVERETSAAVVAALIPIQGKLTDASGSPINGSRTITFKLYDVSSGGTALCSDTHAVSVDNGLFSTSIANCSDEDIDGRQLYLGIQVSGDPEMTPRQAIYTVPYAWSLRPSANISGTTSEAILEAQNWHTSGRGLRGYAMSATGTNYGVVGASLSPSGYGGYFYNSASGGVGLYARGEANADADLVLGGTSDTNDDGRILSDPAYIHSDIVLVTNDALRVDLDEDNNSSSDFEIYNGANTRVFNVNEDGDVSQHRTGDGLVKAGVFAGCGTSASITYYFNNVGGTITIAAGASAGHCTIDFNFDISDRYFVALGMEDNVARGVSCSRSGLPDDQLHCFRWDAGGSGVSGQIMVLVY